MPPHSARWRRSGRPIPSRASTAWDRATAESLLELAARIEAERCRLDAALERDRARLIGEDAPADEAGGAAQAAMDPIDPGMI